jgi:hypothetical protein
VLDGLVRAREFGKVVSSHLGFYLDRVEHLDQVQRVRRIRLIPHDPDRGSAHLSVVDANYTADHFRDDNHVTKVSLYDCGLFIWGCLLLGFS